MEFPGTQAKFNVELRKGFSARLNMAYAYPVKVARSRREKAPAL